MLAAGFNCQPYHGVAPFGKLSLQVLRHMVPAVCRDSMAKLFVGGATATPLVRAGAFLFYLFSRRVVCVSCAFPWDGCRHQVLVCTHT